MHFITDYNLSGLLIGLLSFLIIGLFHPLVIRGEYYFGVRCRWWFAAVGLVAAVASPLIHNFFWSTLLAVFAFSSFWSVKEIKEQEERVHKGWFPRNPRRRYYWDNDSETGNTDKDSRHRE